MYIYIYVIYAYLYILHAYLYILHEYLYIIFIIYDKNIICMHRFLI